MSHARRRATPRLEPELRDQSGGGASIAGGSAPAPESGRVVGATASGVSQVDSRAGVTITLCDGSQYTFARIVDLRTAADT
jgi:hypothetical protein